MRKGMIVATIGLAVAACEAPAENEIAGNVSTPGDDAGTTANRAGTPAERALAVDGEGLRILAAGGPGRALAFGLPEAQVLPVLEAMRGPADRNSNQECGAGPMEFAVWADGLSLLFQEGRFVGWSLDERAAGAHATVSGIGPGSTRAELEAAYAIEVEPSTLGSEFSGDGLSGILNGTGSTARIDTMWAGTSCVFR